MGSKKTDEEILRQRLKTCAAVIEENLRRRAEASRDGDKELKKETEETIREAESFQRRIYDALTQVDKHGYKPRRLVITSELLYPNLYRDRYPEEYNDGE